MARLLSRRVARSLGLDIIASEAILKSLAINNKCVEL